jgi:hypothetical protein
MSNATPVTSDSTLTSAPACAVTARGAGACGDGRTPTHSIDAPRGRGIQLALRRAYVGMSAKGNGGAYHYYACSGRQKLGRKGCGWAQLEPLRDCWCWLAVFA